MTIGVESVHALDRPTYLILFMAAFTATLFMTVALVAILDADKEGFLRSARSLILTIGRASRNARGTVLLYADM